MVLGLLPVVGVPLPLISYGGTVIISVMTGFGIILAVNTNRNINIGKEHVESLIFSAWMRSNRDPSTKIHCKKLRHGLGEKLY